MKNDLFKVRHRNIGQAYSRQDYIHRIPQGKLNSMKFTYGDEHEKFQYELQLISQNQKYLTANSLDAVRVAMGHILADKKFFFKILPYCHIVLREHGLLGVAKAERLAKGMKKSFGKPSSRCAMVNQNQPIIVLRVNDLNLGRKVLKAASKKLKPSWKIVQTKSS